MDRLFALVIALLIPFAVNAQSTVIYPFQHFNNTATVPYTAPAQTAMVRHGGLHNWNIHNGHWKQSASAFSLNNKISQAEAQAISKAITGSAPIAQNAAKRFALAAIPTIGAGLLLTWAATEGWEYLSNQWVKQPTSILPTSPVTNVSHGTWYANAQSYCGNHPDTTIAITGYSGGLPSTGKCNGSQWGPYNGNFNWVAPVQMPQPVPATQQDFDNFASTAPNLTDAQLKEMVDLGFAVPIEKPEATVIDFSTLTSAELQALTDMGYFWPTPDSVAIPISDTYTDPITGAKVRDYAYLNSAPNAGVQITTSKQEVESDGKPKEDPNTPGQVALGQEAKVDPCDLQPDRAGCANLGTLNEAAPTPDATIISLTPDTPWGSDGSCPAPVTMTVMGQPLSFSFDGPCTFFQTMRPIVIAAAWISALFIMMGGAKGNEA